MLTVFLIASGPGELLVFSISDSDNIICPEGCEMFVEMTYGVSDIHWRRVTYCYYGLVVTKPFEGYSRWHETELESTYGKYSWTDYNTITVCSFVI